MDRVQMLKEIDEVSFMVNDLTLYLDTHPTDAEALQAFTDAAKRRKQLMEELNQEHFTWSDGPLPWEGGIL